MNYADWLLSVQSSEAEKWASERENYSGDPAPYWSLVFAKNLASASAATAQNNPLGNRYRIAYDLGLSPEETVERSHAVIDGDDMDLWDIFESKTPASYARALSEAHARGPHNGPVYPYPTPSADFLYQRGVPEEYACLLVQGGRHLAERIAELYESGLAVEYAIHID